MEKQNFSIEGTVALKKAFVEELNLTTSSEGSITEWKYLTNGLRVDLCGVNVEKGLHFKLPQQWDEAVIYAKEFFRKEPKFKIGDYIVAVGSTEEHKVRKITAFKIEGDMFRWEEMGCPSKGEFPHAWNLSDVRHATAEEIEEYNHPKLPVINGYTGEDKGDTLKYGCAELSKKWFTKTANRSIKSMVLSSGVEINAEQIEKIRKYLDY